MMLELFVIVSLFASPPVRESSTRPDVDVKLESNQVPRKTELCGFGPQELHSCGKTVIDGLRYFVAYDTWNRKIKYVRTSDPKFKTLDGLSVGDDFNVKPSQLKTLHNLSFGDDLDIRLRRMKFFRIDILGPASKDGWRPVIGFVGVEGYYLKVSVVGFDKLVKISDGYAEREAKDEIMKCQIQGFVRSTESSFQDLR